MDTSHFSLLLEQRSTLENPPFLVNVNANITVDRATLLISGSGVSGNLMVKNGGSLTISDNDASTVTLSGTGANSNLIYINSALQSSTINIQTFDKSTITANCSVGAILADTHMLVAAVL
ncbi:hypothetical protein SAMD00019534_086510 [Acytostelium subglobosum LB1]|uniref:hypothetical protein n=1 Tax=Acytostelium subglobosum LB1 TaxID=1410327 RepID=UPI0006451933|nr:hypothetical protein SAMD00019534_086510 [Acytostelium subglobosum LB1]GAM25476.1 hypothetical protein SAMD00019534_086510 [Acytostelium subglobosum LB1]|eukprot:XP_012751462.1 hypothetical protein SAMD00019534_086510 [Acytostelium subglobosum LB1]